MAHKIARHTAYWHPNGNSGVIEIEFEGGGKSELYFTAANAIEMTVVLQILQDPNPSFVTNNGWIATRATEPSNRPV